jgi:hypothetical protein
MMMQLPALGRAIGGMARKGMMFRGAPQPEQLQPQRQGPSTGRMIAGHIGDALAQMGGMRPLFAPMMQAQQEAEQQRQQQLAALEARNDERAYQAAEWDRRQATQRSNETWEDNSGNRWRTGANGQPELAFYDPTPRFDSNVSINERGEQVLVRTPRPNGFNPDGTRAVGGQPIEPIAPPNAPPPGFTRRRGGPTQSASGRFPGQ